MNFYRNESISIDIRNSPPGPPILSGRDNRKGWTLIEMLTIIAVIGIIAAIGIPNFSNWIHSFRLKNAASDMMSNLHKARMRAISQNSNCVVSFDLTGSGSYLLFMDDGAGGGTAKNGLRDGSEELIKSVSPAVDNPGIALISVTLDGSSAYGFTPMGLSFVNRSGSVVFQNQRGETRQVDLSAGGNISLH
jgi:type IV fimbrial biogenesis protein FimT